MRVIERRIVLVLGLSAVAAMASAQALPLDPVAARAPAESPAPPKARPATYGTSAISYVEIPASEFFPGDSNETFTTEGSGQGRRWGTAANTGFTAGLHLPSGAIPVYLELDFYDANAAVTVFGSLVVCDFGSANCVQHPLAGAGPGDCLIGGYICSGNSFSSGGGTQSADLTPDVITVDNFYNSYRVYAATFATDGSLKIGGMIVGYVLQVSPAPATPSFNDVPTNHQFFQYIEALKASGITAGCQAAPPLYCPDATLTRGQMAVFLAKALGLQFP